MTSSSCLSTRVCFNSECSNLYSERPRKGWRLRSGELCTLCDGCGSAYEEGKFCETFHANASGWRCCETCGKRVHCGCIVSVNSFTLLDPGGIKCISCARKDAVGLGPSWPSSLFLHAPLPERLKDLPIKNWNQLSGSGPVPWRKAPIVLNSSPSDLHPGGSYDAEISIAIDRMNLGERLPIYSLENKIEDFTMKGSLKLATHETRENGIPNAGINSTGCSSSCVNKPQQMTSVKESQSKTQFGFSAPYSSTNETDGHLGVFGSHLRSTPPPPIMKKFHDNLHNGLDSSSETQIRGGRSRVDARGRSQLLPRYWPKITDQDLQQICGNSNSVITPLFEKMLSASDAGRVGRLVLPKKCAEAYFPPILHPEGLPLKVQDAKGKEWTFQFRFWPNNNSRMYVLEGITPCLQNMQLQAGDIVTFSRLEPEGKLLMGSRKVSAAPPSDQVNGTVNFDAVATHRDAGLADPNLCSKVDEPGYIAKETLGAKASRKRKSRTLDSKSKCLRMESEVIELKLTWKKAQELFRPPPNHVPSIVVIEGFEFEEYEDAPILGKPTIFANDNSGGKVQWVQCERCLKWRKLPVSALLPSYWTCSDNSWNPERSSCSAPQELTEDQLEDLLHDNDLGRSKKTKAAKQHAENTEALGGLDTLANLAIMGEGEALPSSAQATTKHPRHRPGCSCIVCIQPPSGKGPKHKQSCTCNVCQSVKRRFRTLMLRREKKQSEKEFETTCKKKQQEQTENSGDNDPCSYSNAGNSLLNQQTNLADGCNDDSITKSSDSLFIGQIDLNIQPEREEEPSPGPDSEKIMRMLQDANERYLQQQRLSSVAIQRTSSGHIDSVKSGEELSNNDSHGNSHQDAEKHNGA